jgi:signal transduction histidine kinase
MRSILMTAEASGSSQGLEGSGRERVRLSVRGRVLASVLAMTALGMAVTGGTAFLIQDRLVNAGITVTLEQEVEEFRRMAVSGVDPQTGAPFTSVESLLRFAIEGNVPHRNETYMTLLNGSVLGHEGGVRPIKLESEESILAAVTDAAKSPGVSIQDVQTSAGRARLAIVPVGLPDDPASGTYVMAFAVDRGRDDLVRVALIYLLASLGSLILVGVVGWLVAGRLLKPLRTLRENSQRINETDLTERIPVQGNDDISELTRTYNQMLDRLQIAIDTQRRFLDDAGHELRTPLTILRGQLEVLDPADPFDVTETRSLLLDEIDRMGRMVEELILLSKAQRPDFLVCRSIDLAPFTEDLLDKARALGDRHWRLHERGDAQFVGDAHRLTQAMLELARNAVKFSAVGSDISIGSRAAAGEVRLWVCDAGVGIRAGELDRVFERFSRASSGLGVEGSGLGLSIVEAIATAHSGRAEVVSEPGVGSTFTIVLPQPYTGPALRPSSMHRDTAWSAP